MTLEHGVAYPFSALVGQEALKKALLLNAVDPRVGGVLIRGQKGTAKSTAVRALRDVLPEIEVVDGCRFGCDPSGATGLCPECAERVADGPLPQASRPPSLVDLPVSATEDRVVGTIDLEHALKHGERRFEAGLLASAHRGILYVDEVNLLDDHLVDTLLDVAASGVNVVEREGVRYEHPSRFMLVGTMNPEEGDVRPQLLDRFGLCVDVEGIADPNARVDILRRRRAFEDDPPTFCREWAAPQAELAQRLARARATLPDVELDDDLLYLVASICSELGIHGHRADLVIGRAAVAHALLDGRREVTPVDVLAVAPMAIAHRMRGSSLEAQPSGPADLGQVVAAIGTGRAENESAEIGRIPTNGADTAVCELLPDATIAQGTIGTTSLSHLAATLDRTRRDTQGRRQPTTTRESGRYVRSEQAREGLTGDVALDATIRAAAPHQLERGGELAITVAREDVRTKVRRRRVGASIVFCVDASGSMGASNRMELAKSAILDLLVDAYQRRDRVGLVAFRGGDAEVMLQPTASVELAQLRLRELPSGGATPMAHGIMKSLEVLTAETRRDGSIVPWLVLVTDGRANVGLAGGLGSEDARAAAGRLKAEKINTLVVDTTERGSATARELALVAGGEYVCMRAASGAMIAGAVRDHITD